MSSKGIGNRIDELAEDYRHRRPLLLSGWRALLWFCLSLAGACVLFRVVQHFREGFLPHMLEHPLLLLEVLSAAGVVAGGSAWAFARCVPGERVSRRTLAAVMAATVTFALTMALSFSRLSAEHTAHGGRAMCWLEVIVCGSLTLALLMLALRRGYPRFRAVECVGIGLIAGLPGGALMQLACLYQPSHGLLFHYLPMLAVTLLALALCRLLRR